LAHHQNNISKGGKKNPSIYPHKKKEKTTNVAKGNLNFVNEKKEKNPI
jgi:hypothetical protein